MYLKPKEDKVMGSVGNDGGVGGVVDRNRRSESEEVICREEVRNMR